MPAKATTTTRLYDGVLVVIVLIVGLMAGAASFTHVHDFTIDNSPAGTADWFGWANAVISELIPTASLIEIGRRRRKNPAASVSYPMVLLVSSVGVSLTAQLAVATPSVFGWMVSALPALAFFALSKLVFTATTARPTNPVTAPEPATSPATSPDTERVKVTPAADTPTTRATTPPKTAIGDEDTSTTDSREDATAPAPAPTAPAKPATVTAPPETTPVDKRYPHLLLGNARTIATAHRATHGEPITAGQLAVRLKVPTTTAHDILTHLHDNPPTAATTRPHNGSTVGANA